MRKIILLFSILFISIGTIYSQTYEIDQYNGQTITSCGGSFYDSGGQSSGYTSGESYIVTFAPTTNFSNVTFNSFNVVIGDMLEVFDGADVSAQLIAIYNNGNSPVGQTVRASFLGSQGKLTFRWTSVGASSGWDATVSCGVPCQSFNTIITQSTPPFTIEDSIYFIDICPGDTVQLRASADFYLNNAFYHQDTTTTDFTWNFGLNNSVIGQNITTTLNSAQGYNAYIIATDTIGCSASQATEVRIRVSTQPVFDGTTIARDEICQNDTTLLMGMVEPTPWSITPSLSVAGTTYLPDGSGVSYTSNLNFSGFATGQVLQNASDILKIFMEIEHSYIGDLNLVIKCPNNSAVTLKSYPGGGANFLGEPTDGNSSQIPGLGYMYHWSAGGTTTMANAFGLYQYSFTDLLGSSYTNHNYLPPSTAYPATSTATGTLPIVQYKPETPFNNFLGCPLNGNWSITVTDNLSIDNGFIFQWGIDFSPSLLPVAWGYTPVVDTTHWNVGVGDTTIFNSIVSGSQSLTYSMTDMAGCTYDTSINIFVNPVPDIDLGNDTNICIFDSIMLQSNNTINSTDIVWSSGDTGDSVLVIPESTQEFSIIATSILGCVSYDTIEVALAPLPTIQISDDTLICIGTTASLAASGGTIYQWSNGINTDNNIVSPVTTSIYQLTVTDQNACVDDTSVTVTVATLPNIIMSNDTVICDGTTANIKAKGGINYSWSNGISTANQTVSPASTTTYSVKVEDENTCIDSADIIVEILDIPEATITSNYDTICRNGTIKLYAHGGMSYKWNNGKTDSGIEEHAKVSDRYSVLATNTKYGTSCYDTTSIYVVVENCAVYIPNAFTPNGDALNDIFIPEGIVSNTAKFNMFIYNRLGQLVFESNDINKGWNGKFRGQKMPTGTYTWLIRVTEKSIDSYELVGTVHLLR